MGWGGDAVDAAGAVAAVNAWVGRVELLDATAVPVSGASPVLIYRLDTPSLQAGDYRLYGSSFLKGTNAGTEYEITFELDGVPNTLATASGSFNVTNGVFIFTALLPAALAAGTHRLDVFAAQPGGPGSMEAILTYIGFERVQL